jgi:hypothetical protein
MTARYVYLDKSLQNTVTGSYTDGWYCTSNTGLDTFELWLTALTGDGSPSDYIDENVAAYNYEDYWLTVDMMTPASGFAVLPFEPFTLDPSSISLVMNVSTQGNLFIKNVYLYYDSGINPTMAVPRAWLASGYITPYEFTSDPSFAIHDLPLDKVDDVNCTENLKISGNPTIEFLLDSLDGLHAIAALTLLSSGIPSAVSENNNINLFIHGDLSTSDTRVLYTEGHLPLSSGLDLYLSNNVLGSSIPLYTHGSTPGSGSIDLYTYASMPFSGSPPDDLNLYIYGITSNTETLNLYLNGGIGIPTSGTQNLYVWGTIHSGIFKTLELNLNVDSIPNEYILPLHIGGDGYLGNPSGTLPLHIFNDYTYFSSVDLFLCNLYTGSSGFLPLYITTPSGTDGAVPVSGTMILYISRNSESLSSMVPMYIDGPALTSGTLDLYILCGYSGATGTMDLTMSSTSEQKVNYITLYTHGF